MENTDLNEDWRKRANKNRLEAIKKLSTKYNQQLSPLMIRKIDFNRNKAQAIRDGKERTARNRLKAQELRRNKTEGVGFPRIRNCLEDQEELENEKVAVEGLEKYKTEICNERAESIHNSEINPLDMPEILENVFKHLSIEDLLSCREVNVDWKIESTKSLLSILRPMEQFDWYVLDPGDPDFGQRRV